MKIKEFIARTKKDLGEEHSVVQGMGSGLATGLLMGLDPLGVIATLVTAFHPKTKAVKTFGGNSAFTHDNTVGYIIRFVLAAWIYVLWFRAPVYMNQDVFMALTFIVLAGVQVGLLIINLVTFLSGLRKAKKQGE